VFTSNLTGTRDAPIKVRQYPGERAIVEDSRARANGATLNIHGEWTTYQDFEVTDTNSDRGYDWKCMPNGCFRPMAFEVQAPHTKFINLVIHDTGHGFGFWKEAVDSELYGNLIFNIGSKNLSMSKHHGHGVYTQNNTGTKQIRDNIIFNTYGWGIHAYPNPGDMQGFDIEGNVIFNTGVLNDRATRYNAILVSGYAPYHGARIVVANNYTYESPEQKNTNNFSDANLCLGCSDPQDHEDVAVRDNYFAGGAPVAYLRGWHTVTFNGNTMIGQLGMLALSTPQGVQPQQYNWDGNQYFGYGYGQSKETLFSLNGKILNFNAWQQAAGVDKSSHYAPAYPSSVKVVVRPNQYESGRVTIIVYNWSHQRSVDVDLGSALTRGTPYEIRNVQDFFGNPVVSGNYDGHAIALPLAAATVTRAIGASVVSPPSGPDFDVFLVRSPRSQEPPPAEPPSGQGGGGQKLPPSTAAGITAKLVGTYTSSNPRARVVITSDGANLKAVMAQEPGQPEYALQPISSTRFRMLGAPGDFYIQFNLAGDKVQSMTVERGKYGNVTLQPQR
jgi:Right handed beta helix region